MGFQSPLLSSTQQRVKSDTGAIPVGCEDGRITPQGTELSVGVVAWLAAYTRIVSYCQVLAIFSLSALHVLTRRTSRCLVAMAGSEEWLV
jgi:hypothetical protein